MRRASLRAAAAMVTGLGLAVTACGSDASAGTTDAGGTTGVSASVPATVTAPGNDSTASTATSTAPTGSTAAPAGSAPTSSAPASSAPATSVAISESPPADELSVYFGVSGGVAGVSRSIAIAPDGGVVRTDRGVGSQGTIDDAEAEGIRAALDRSGLFDKDRQYKAPPGSADLFRYEIRYRGVTVVADDTEVPDELSDAVATLQALLDQR